MVADFCSTPGQQRKIIPGLKVVEAGLLDRLGEWTMAPVADQLGTLTRLTIKDLSDRGLVQLPVSLLRVCPGFDRHIPI